MRLALPAFCLLLAACQPGDGAPGTGPTDAYDGIAPTETVQLTGTEPFWHARIAGATATYVTPERQEGITFDVDRFAGNNGLAFTGRMEGQSFDLTITPGRCSDGMSDRSYPYTATLQIADEQRNGCAWTDAQPFAGAQQP